MPYGRRAWQKYHSRCCTSSRELSGMCRKMNPGLLIHYHPLFRGTAAEDLWREIREIDSGEVADGRDPDVGPVPGPYRGTGRPRRTAGGCANRNLGNNRVGGFDACPALLEVPFAEKDTGDPIQSGKMASALPVGVKCGISAARKAAEIP